jgi:hypothetical protein
MMMRFHSRVSRILLGACAAGIVLLFFTAQAPAPKKHAKGPAISKKTAAARRIADSIAVAVRADSVRKAAAQALADSLQREALAAAARRRADSLAATRLRKVKNEAFAVGERLVFSVNYGIVTAGEAVMEIPAYDSVAGRRCFKVEFRVNSLPSFSWIYKVEDRYLTFIDAETIAPWKFEQHIREGNYRRDFIAEFDQVAHVARTTEGSYPIPPYVHDILSAFYYARTIDFAGMAVGSQIILHNFYKDTTHELAVRLLGRQDLEVEAGTFRTVVVEPMVKEGGLFKAEGRIVIWLTDDERKIPIRVNTKVVIGSIDTELKQYSGMPGPVNGRIK